ncbi:MAG TPA: cyclase family protein [Ktedonobacteraceae bacterium]|nr:cyclase family protein [Ktedonobacteraceae bacterium]
MDQDQLFALLPHLRVYDLEQPRYFGAPTMAVHEPGFVYKLHRRHEPEQGEARTGASGFFFATEHSGTHIDALCHQAENLSLYGGRAITPRLQTSTGFTELGAETIPPLIARGILLDVAAYLGVDCIAEDRPITRADLEQTAQSQGVTIQAGDVVLVRIGNGARWQQPEVYLNATGVDASGSHWLANQQVRAVGADNMAWDIIGKVDPDLGVSLPGHVILLVRHGIYILENLFLEELAQQKQYEFLFICLPLKMQGATGSLVRPVAAVPGTA